MSQEIKHWAEKLEVGDKCLATIRHKTDGSKNLHNVEVIVVENAKRLRSVTAWFPEYQVEIPYNDLTEMQKQNKK